MLNFNTNIQEVVANQETVKRTHAFEEFNSKKKLFESGRLDESKQAYIAQLKGTFTFHLHEANRYLVVTMYYSNTKKYGFLVVDLETLACAEADSVKNAKREVLEIVASETGDAVEAEQEAEVEEAPMKTVEEILKETDEILKDAEETVEKTSKKHSK